VKFTRDYDKVFNDGRREQVRGELDPGATIGYLMLAGLALLAAPVLFLLPLFFYIRYPLKNLKNIDLEEASDLLKQNGYEAVEEFRSMLKYKTYFAYVYMAFYAIFCIFVLLSSGVGKIMIILSLLAVACYPYLVLLINKERYLSKLILKEKVNIVESTFFNRPVLTKNVSTVSILSPILLMFLAGYSSEIIPALFLLPLFFYVRYPLKKLKNIELEEASGLLKQNGYETIEKFRFVLKAKTYLAFMYMVFLAIFADMFFYGQFEFGFGWIIDEILIRGTALAVACYPFLSVLINKERYLSKLILKEKVNIVESTFVKRPILTKIINAVWALLFLFIIYKIVVTS
jgi:hypothetical protein